MKGHSPPQQLPEQLDYLVVDARALPLRYERGEVDEDTARVRLGDALRWLCANDPKYAAWQPGVERLIAAGERGDALADEAVRDGSSELIQTAEYVRDLWHRSALWVELKLRQTKKAAAVLMTPRAA